MNWSGPVTILLVIGESGWVGSENGHHLSARTLTPLRNIHAKRWRHPWRRRFVFAYSANLQRRLSDGDGDTLDQPHAGQRLVRRMDVGHVAFNRPTRLLILRLQTSTRSSATDASTCMISDFHCFHDAIACFSMMQYATQMAQQCPTLHVTTKPQVEWSRSCCRRQRLTLLLPYTRVPLIWYGLYHWQQLLFQSYHCRTIVHLYTDTVMHLWS